MFIGFRLAAECFGKPQEMKMTPIDSFGKAISLRDFLKTFLTYFVKLRTVLENGNEMNKYYMNSFYNCLSQA